MAFGTIKHVRKVFAASELTSGSTEPVVALDDASFDFDEGQLVALLGPSGCGKTTLLRIMAGLIPKTSGSVVIGGREVTEPLGDYGFVFQQPSLMPWRSVIDNVLFTMEILKRNDRAARERATHLLERRRTFQLHAVASASIIGGHAAACRTLPRADSSAETAADG